jgi:hypothetical protein
MAAQVAVHGVGLVVAWVAVVGAREPLATWLMVLPTLIWAWWARDVARVWRGDR